MTPPTEFQIPLLPAATGLPPEMENYPRFRYMGSKFRLLGWIHGSPRSSNNALLLPSNPSRR